MVLKRGMALAVLKQLGKLPSLSELFMILVIGVLITSPHFFNNEFGIGSRSHVLVFEDARIFRKPV